MPPHHPTHQNTPPTPAPHAEAAARPTGSAAASDLYVGLMTGTSLDGVDAALVRFTPHATGLHILGRASARLPASLRDAFMALQTAGTDEIHRSQCAAIDLTRLYASTTLAMLQDLGVAPDDVTAIGVHGQTVRHRPELGYTVQLNQPALLAELTGIDVIADFRTRDIAAGGQGAPLVPAFHQAVFSAPDRWRVLVNIGGISNLSILAPHNAPAPARGHDCGPGNILMDLWTARHLGQPYDQDGAWAARGQVHAELLSTMLADPYFGLPPPKSTGRDLFHTDWLKQFALEAHPAADVQATLCALTAQVIADDIRQYAPPGCDVYICGGGAQNATLMASLSQALADVATVQSTAALGCDPQAVEAAAFGWLACQTRHGLPGNLPSVTGAQGPRVLGAIYPR